MSNQMGFRIQILRPSSMIARQVGHRTVLGVPLICAREAIGAIFVRRTEVRPFTDRQIDLLKIFADQAVNAISRSTTDVQPVFDAIVESAAKLFDPCIVNINSLEDAQQVYRAAASVRYELKIEAAKSFYPIPFDPERSAASRAILEQRIVEIPDAAAPDTPELTRKAQQALGNYRSVTFVPLIREGKGIGVISLAHPEPGFKLGDKQLALVQTFADQAVIAIENTRLFEAEQASTRELQESLEYQTAISEVLGVISRSQTEIRPVFDAILESAVRLCDADQGGTAKVENGMLIAINWYPDTPESSQVFSENFPRPVDRTSLIGRAVLDGKVL